MVYYNGGTEGHLQRGRAMTAQAKSITTNKGETLTLTKLGKSRISFGWYRRIERVIYEADDGSYWAQYDNRWNELASYVETVDGERHFCNKTLRFAY